MVHLEASAFTSYGHFQTSISPHENETANTSSVLINDHHNQHHKGAGRDANMADESNKSTASYSKLGHKALLRKLMMKNAKTKLDHIVAKYNYTAPKDGSSSRRNR